MTSECSGSSSSGEWSIVDATSTNKTADETQSDIEVISNPPSEPAIVMDQPPRLLYSEVLQRPPVPESDIEFVPEPTTPELEFDDQEYLNEVLRSANLDSDSASSEDSEDGTCCLPANVQEMKPAMTHQEVFDKEVVLEVNLTLLSFTIIVGVSGMSGFLLGGIYSAVLTNNISHSTDLAQYPGTLPSFLYSGEASCPTNGCESKLFRLEENMKHLKQTLSHDIRDCHNKLKSTVKQNAALHKTNKETAEYANKKCADSRSELKKLQSESAELLAELETQRDAFKSFKHETNTEAARNVLQIATLAQTLENTKVDLEKARQAISVLDGLNTECRKNSILNSYSMDKASKKRSEDSAFWKNLYRNTVYDLEKAEKRANDLDESLKKELENLKESQVSESNAKIQYLKERNSKQYFKRLADRYEDMLETMENKYVKARSKQQQLGLEFQNLKTLTSEMELNLETCSNATVRAETRAKQAVMSKEYIENILMKRISNDKEEYKVLKSLYKNQMNVIAEMETQKSTLEDSLVRKISSNRQKFLTAKDNLENALAAFGANKKDTTYKYDVLRHKVGRSRGEKKAVQEELERSKSVIAEYREQIELFQSYISQIEVRLLKLKEDVVMRNAIQKEYLESVSRQHRQELAAVHSQYKNQQDPKLTETKLALETISANLSQKTDALNKLQKKHDKVVRELKEEESAVKYWKDAAKFQKHQAGTCSANLDRCKRGENTAIIEYKKTTEMLVDLIKGVASKPKCDISATPVLYDQPSYTPYPPKSFIFLDPPHPSNSSLSPVSDELDVCQLNYTQVARELVKSKGERKLLLQDLYNTTNSDYDVETCYNTFSPLFPGVPSQTLADVINMTQSRDRGRKMSSALSKYWGDIDKTYSKLYKKGLRKMERDDDDDDDEDWYFKRFRSSKEKDTFYPRGPNNGRAQYSRQGEGDWYMAGRDRKGEGEYSYVNKQRKNKGGFDCAQFDCRRGARPFLAYQEVAFRVCGC